ncbi:hypothetical protein WAF17_10700 [Bernardetia sp. ABR2-2B]|uniref:hypothetical protein n=1 Tax=Bernardetia sp. ABR2-2B TaxID=3127472 RepID=UPI0030CF9E89
MNPVEDQVKETLAIFLKELTELHEADEKQEQLKKESEKVNTLIVEIDERGSYLTHFFNAAESEPNEHLAGISYNDLKRQIQILNSQKRKEKQTNS